MPFDATTADVAALPYFKPRRDQSRLDLRPVAWSLRNRPEEWRPSSPGITIEHVPSGHVFWVGNGIAYYDLHSADRCSCTSVISRPLLRDRLRFHFAYREWLGQQEAARMANINRQFATHFLTPSSH